MSKSVIVLEFNELTPHLMDGFIAQGLLPGFAKLRSQSVVAVTDAGETGEALEPWVQWTTVHTGAPFAEHKVFKLSDGPDCAMPRVWDAVSEAGEAVWVCGSMNAAFQGEAINGLVLPDPWAAKIRPFPEAYFAPFYDFVSKYVKDYNSSDAPVSRAEIARFARFMVTNGLSLKTAFKAVRQILGEYRGLPKWRRASILDRLQWDVFRHNYKKLRPALSTFFINSTAHYQHYYWRDMAPELFTIKPSERQTTAYRDAILFGYQAMDAIVEEALALCDDETSVVLCTALSQQPMLKYEEDGGKLVFKPKDPDALLRLAGVQSPYRYVPVMAEEFQVHFETAAAAEDACAKISALRLSDGRPLMRLTREGETVYGGCAVYAAPAEDVTIAPEDGASPVLFATLFLPLEGIKSGMHHPDGILWVRTPERRHAEVKRKVALEEIAPTLTYLCGVVPGSYARPAIPEVVFGDQALAA